MARRFARLEAEIIALLKAGADPSASQDEAIKKYWSWKIRKDKAQHQRAEASTRQTKGTTRVILFPFAVSGTIAHHYAALSTRAYESALVKDATGKVTLFNWKTGVAAGTSVQNAKSFSPAKVVARQKSTTETKETSKITGRDYKTKSAASQQGFIYPFGRDATKTELEIQKDILTAIKDNFSVSFHSEIYTAPDNVQGFAA